MPTNKNQVPNIKPCQRESLYIYRKSMRNITPQEMCRLWFSHEQLEKVYVHLKHMNKTLTPVIIMYKIMKYISLNRC